VPPSRIPLVTSREERSVAVDDDDDERYKGRCDNEEGRIVASELTLEQAVREGGGDGGGGGEEIKCR